MVCPNCKSDNIEFQVVEEHKKAGLGLIIWYIILFVTVLGWLILIPMLLRKRTETVTYAVCKDCGKRWKVTEREVRIAKQNMQKKG